MQRIFFLEAWRWCSFFAGFVPIYYISEGVVRLVEMVVESQFFTVQQALYFAVSIHVRLYLLPDPVTRSLSPSSHYAQCMQGPFYRPTPNLTISIPLDLALQCLRESLPMTLPQLAVVNALQPKRFALVCSTPLTMVLTPASSAEHAPPGLVHENIKARGV